MTAPDAPARRPMVWLSKHAGERCARCSAASVQLTWYRSEWICAPCWEVLHV